MQSYEEESGREAQCHTTSTGTVCEFDANEQLGLIESDDGRILPFKLKDVPSAMLWRFGVGGRVRFIEQCDRVVARATALVPIEGEDLS
jgi:hypothetical protein